MSFVSTNYDYKTALQLYIEMSESDFASDGSSSTVTANYYLTSVNQPTNAFNGDITSDYGTSQTITGVLGSKSQTFSTNAFAIANAIDKFGDKFYIGSISTVVKRASNGLANIKVSASTTLTWVSGYPSRSVSGIYSCIDTIHTVAYNANGGTNAPTNQNKCYGYMLTLRTQIPNRNGYKFMGWSTSPNGSVVYTAGDVYGIDQDVTLYAVWKLIDINMSLSGVDIRIPCVFKTGKYGISYFFSDPDYYIELPYTYSFAGKISSLKAQPFYIDESNVTRKEKEQSLYGSSGKIRVSMNTIGNSIIVYGSKSEVPINVLFSFNIDGIAVELSQSVTCKLKDFNFFTVQESSAYLSSYLDNLMYFKLLVTYPKSYNPDVILANAYPMFMYDLADIMLSVGKQTVNEGSMIITCCVDTTKLKNGLVNINYPDSVLLYDESLTFNKYITVRYPLANNNIVIKSNGDYEGFEFIETDHVAGFLKGGYVCGKEFIEDCDSIVINNDGFQVNEIKEVY